MRKGSATGPFLLVRRLCAPASYRACFGCDAITRTQALLLLLSVTIAMHALAAASRVADALLDPVPAATMSPTHRAAECLLGACAPISRISGAELWNVSRQAGPTEFRGRDAVVAFVQSVALITITPWRESVVIDPHPAANWNSERVELTASLEPLLQPMLAVALACGAAFVLWRIAVREIPRQHRAWIRWSVATPPLIPSFCAALLANRLPLVAAVPLVGVVCFCIFLAWTRPLRTTPRDR